MEEGYVKMYRKMLDSPILRDSRLSQVWLWCLLKANWKPGKFHGVDIPAGSFVCDLRGAAATLKLPKTTLKRCFDRMSMAGQIRFRSVRLAGHAFSVVSVCNWATYQGLENDVRDKSGPQAGQERFDGGPKAGQIEEERIKKEEEEAKSSGGKPPKTPRKRKPVYMQGGEPVPEPLAASPKFVEAWKLWLSHRASIAKPYKSPESERTQLETFLYWGVDRSVAAIRYSVAAGYQGIFEEKQSSHQPLFQKPKVCEGI